MAVVVGERHGGWRCAIMEARGVGRNGNGMDSWRGRGGGDEAGDVAGSCSTRRRGLMAAQMQPTVKIATFIPSCLPTSDECTNNNEEID